MAETTEWGLIGAGNIGSELMRQLGQDYVAERFNMSRLPSFVVRSSGIMEADCVTPSQYECFDDIDDLPDVLFLAIPSSDDGEVAHNYISSALDRGTTIVTAEKGSIANHFPDLRWRSKDFKYLGVNATVGGGTRMLDVARNYCQDVENITQIHLALNGTLSAIMSSVGPVGGFGMSFGKAVRQAVQQGYAEPGSSSPGDVLKAEAEGDIPKKTAIFFNKLGLSATYVDWRNLKFELTDEQISHAVEEAKIRRFVVSLYSPNYLSNVSKCPEDAIIGGFDVEHDGWRLVGGFRHVDRNPLFAALTAPSGPSNGFVIGLGPDETDGVYSLVGPGAGVKETANTMIDDFVSRRANRE